MICLFIAPHRSIFIMATKRRPQKAKKVKPQPKPVVRRVRKRAMGHRLDPVASSYAHLLNDPCNAPLCHPVYAGGEGGYLARYEKDYIVNQYGIANTAGAICFTPALLCNHPVNTVVFANSTAHSAVYLASSSSSPATTPVVDNTACEWYSDNGGQPGYDQLITMAGGVRCVAACMQITFPGTELNRSGIVSLAQLPDAAAVLRSGSDAGPAATFTVGELRSVSPMVSRTPETTLEVKWKPSFSDQRFKTPNVTSHTDIAQHSCLTATWSGIPASTGMRIRVVAVYEWVPKASNGLMNSNESRARTPCTLDQVLNYLDQAGNWVYGSMKYTAAAYKAYQTLLGTGARSGRITYGEL